jgi:hypothetical protein
MVDFIYVIIDIGWDLLQRIIINMPGVFILKNCLNMTIKK